MKINAHKYFKYILVYSLFIIVNPSFGQWTTSESNIFNINSGNVGIGMSSPQFKLDVNGSSNIRGWDAVYSTINGDGTFIQLIGTYQGWNKNTVYIAGYNSSNNSGVPANSVSFGGSGVERLWVNLLSGNVGIGTTTPAGKLEIKGPYNGNSQLIINSIASNAELRFSSDDVTKGFVWYSPGEDCMAFGRGSLNNSLFVNSVGNFGIGLSNPKQYKLNVAGTIRADEIVVNTDGADFVFEPTYKLRSLSELEAFIKANKHLPDIAPAKEMQENGVSAGEMQAKLLQKVEELTLYLIEKDKEITTQNRKMEKQDLENAELKKMILEMRKEIEILKSK